MSPLSEKQDLELVELLTGDSQEAFGELYARYRDRLMYVGIRFLKSEADAEDVFHDIFLKIWDKRHFLGTVTSFSGLVKTMTQNYAMDKLRHSDVHSRFAENLLVNVRDSTNETEDTIVNNDYTELLNKLIKKLPLKQQEVFRLNRIERLSYQQISELLQMPVANVRK